MSIGTISSTSSSATSGSTSDAQSTIAALQQKKDVITKSS